MIEIIIYLISFISLFLAIFWISTLFLEEDQIHEKKVPKRFPSVSILVPAYNEESTIAKTLDSLLKLKYPKGKLEIIVIANACTDRTEDIVKKYKAKGVKLISIPEPGKAHAVNIGIKAAKGSLIGVFDADSLVKPNALKLVVPYFEDQKVAAAISSLKVHKPRNFLEKLQWFEYLTVTLVRRLMASLDVLFMTPGVLSLYRKSVLIKVGGFDEETLTEDIEIAMRLLYKGYKVRSQLDAITYVVSPKTFKAFHRQRVRWCRGFFTTTIKYRDMLLNPKYSMLGLFILPICFILPFILMVVVSLALHSMAQWMYQTAISLYVVGWDWTFLIPQISLKEFLLDTRATIALPTLAIAASGIYLLTKSHEHLREKWRFPLTAIIFLTFYQFVLAAYWLIAIFYELFKVKKSWRGTQRW